MPENRVEVVIVGAGAAGLMCAITAARSALAQSPRILVLDGAATLGAKILVSGGGRCNVTHDHVDDREYSGGSRNTIRKVLQQYGAPQTVAFFRELGVELKREKTGKLFPVTDRARTVLDALLTEARKLKVELIHPWRVAAVERGGHDTFMLHRADGTDRIHAERIVLATGGMALPKSGSDGGGYELARSLGHTLTPRIFPALVPLVVGPMSRWITELAGLSARVGVEVRSATGRLIVRFTDSVLCTHFGLSGPAIMDASRWLTDARFNDKGASLRIVWLPESTFETVDQTLISLGQRTPLSWLREQLPERLARAICDSISVDAAQPGHQLTKEARRSLAHALVEMPVDIAHDRGFTHAEVTAGGVPLSEINAGTMQSRVCEHLWLVGEILDVDGRIGGFNFQWAWASGHAAGVSVVRCSK